MKKLSILLSFCAIAGLVNPIEAAFNQDEYYYLDEIALRTGADKGSSYHNYTEVYSQYFAPLKQEPIKFLEIGIYKGASVKMWEEYFKNADLHFMDITFQAVEYFSNRSQYHLCDQASPDQLQRFIQSTDGNFDIILDDGGHTMDQQITSFMTLFPHVKSGGMYIIEDLHTSYWSSYGGGGTNSTINFLKQLIDDVNYVGQRTTRASHLNLPPSVLSELNIYREKIKSIHFYDSIAIIMKR
ncbi:MAG: class I SAM-dependent methyltransferase [Verrucomicrobia bacterium]|nr:class I SAM-dependent methyltransferase [Verrucomicrobiota bacterium]